MPDSAGAVTECLLNMGRFSGLVFFQVECKKGLQIVTICNPFKFAGGGDRSRTDE